MAAAVRGQVKKGDEVVKGGGDHPCHATPYPPASHPYPLAPLLIACCENNEFGVYMYHEFITTGVRTQCTAAVVR